MGKIYTLNKIFEEEKRNWLLKRREGVSDDELRLAEQSIREAEIGLNTFCRNISEQIPSPEQAAAVFDEISTSENSVDMVLRIHQRSGSVSREQTTGISSSIRQQWMC